MCYYSIINYITNTCKWWLVWLNYKIGIVNELMNFFVLLLGVLLAFWVGRRQVNITRKQVEISQDQAKTMSNQLLISTIQYKIDLFSTDLSMVNDRIQFLTNKIQGGRGYTSDMSEIIPFGKEKEELLELENDRRNLTVARWKTLEQRNEFIKSQLHKIS